MKNDVTIVTLGSHSALDICRGAKNQGLKTLVVAQKGRDKTYANYYKTQGSVGCVDEIILVDKFKEILRPEIQKQLIDQHAIFIPNRSFEVYINDYDAIENDFKVKMFGNRKLLRVEERGVTPNQYDLLDAANIRYPKQFKNPKDVDRLCIVKVLEKERGFERSFFLVGSFTDYQRRSEYLLKEGTITKKALEKAVIEEFVVGVHVNFNFFYSPIHKRLELLGTDMRRQTNLEGILRLPGTFQDQALKEVSLKYEEAGHVAVTVLESLLEDAFSMGERFVVAAKKFHRVGVIGPFALQTIITAGPPKKEIIVIDVSPRMPGSPGIAATPYSGYLFGKSISVGERVAMEIKQAIQSDKLDTILT